MLYPLKFKSVYKDYIWGGRGLEKLGKKLPEGIVAESWEISSHPDGESKVLSGEYKDISISELTKIFGKDLIGSELDKKDLEKFPLLIKLIDANDKLSVQVHPEDEYAKVHENGELGKNEMWYIVSAKPGAKIVYGVSKGVTKEIFQAAVKADKVETCLNHLEVFAGDTVNIPAGMLHAIGDGIVIAEIQQNSNTTYRVFDYNRTDAKGIKRPLHIEKALEVIDFNNCNIQGKQEGIQVKLEKNSSKHFLLANEYFSVEKYSIAGKIQEQADGSRFCTYTCLQGEGEIVYSGGTVKLKLGESILIPASLGSYTIEGHLELIKAYVPNIKANVIEPLLRAGYNSEEIYLKVIG
ncbi:MAG: class I mannose-6-phosphate isomerase [Clostridiaceae bacterium]|nr:class I mannose-6-phosphate isomerase [Clostridiaceae bacterium]